MPQSLTRWILISGFLLQGVLSYSQATEFPVGEWIKQLSSKKDDRYDVLNSIAFELSKLDSADRCLALSLLDERGPESKIFRFRLNFIRASQYRSFLHLSLIHISEPTRLLSNSYAV